MWNRTKTVLLLSGLTALVGWGGHAIAGQAGLVFGPGLAAAMNAGAWWWSDKLVLKMFGAKRLAPGQAPQLYALVKSLAARHGLPMPAIYLVPQPAPNAFATGRNPEHAAVAVTAGLLELLDRQELEGVLGHELAHIANRDTLVSTIAATLAGALSLIGDMAIWSHLAGGRSEGDDAPHPLAGVLGIIVAPLAGLLIQAAISRSREFLADESGAQTTGQALALASALRKLEAWKLKTPLAQATPSVSHLFIVNPLAGQRMLELFSTHPPTRERVRRLERVANAAVGIAV